jgi:hypothetical protein
VVERVDISELSEAEHEPLNIIFICGEFPNPIHGGGTRVSDFIKILSRENNIYLYTWYIEHRDRSGLEMLKPFCEEIIGVSYEEFMKGNSDTLKELINGSPFDVVHYEWLRAVLHYKPDLGKCHLFTYHNEAVSLRLIMDMSTEKPLSRPWMKMMVELINTLKIEILDSLLHGRLYRVDPQGRGIPKPL